MESLDIDETHTLTPFFVTLVQKPVIYLTVKFLPYKQIAISQKLKVILRWGLRHLKE